MPVYNRRADPAPSRAQVAHTLCKLQLRSVFPPADPTTPPNILRVYLRLDPTWFQRSAAVKTRKALSEEYGEAKTLNEVPCTNKDKTTPALLQTV